MTDQDFQNLLARVKQIDGEGLTDGTNSGTGNHQRLDASARPLPSTGSGRALNQEGSPQKLPSSDAEGRRLWRRGGVEPEMWKLEFVARNSAFAVRAFMNWGD